MLKINRVLITKASNVGFKNRLLSPFRDDGVRFAVQSECMTSVKNNSIADITVNDASGLVLFRLAPGESRLIDDVRDVAVFDNQGYIFIDAPHALSATIETLPILDSGPFKRKIEATKNDRRAAWLLHLPIYSGVTNLATVQAEVQRRLGDVKTAPALVHQKYLLAVLNEHLPEVSARLNTRIWDAVGVATGASIVPARRANLPVLSYMFDTTVHASLKTTLLTRGDIVSLELARQMDVTRSEYIAALS